MNSDDVVLTFVLAASGLVALWPALRLSRRCGMPPQAGVVAFFSAYALTAATAFAAGLVLDAVRSPYMPPPPPGNFTIPLPWALVAPLAAAIIWGPIAGAVAAARAVSLARRRSPPSDL